MTMDTLPARESAAAPLAPSEMNAADPLPHGAWTLVKGGWDVAANGADLEVAGALQRLGRDWSERETELSDRLLHHTRLVELRGIGRVEDARAKKLGHAGNKKASKPATVGNDRPSLQLGRYFRYQLKRMFRKKAHQKDS